jgi:hypothetical protein
MTKLTANCVVYRVVPYVGHDDETNPPNHAVEARIVKSAGKMITLARSFTDRLKTRYDQKALGRVFFETPLQAITNFAAEQRIAIDSADRARHRAERALFWAYEQGAPVPKESR